MKLNHEKKGPSKPVVECCLPIDKRKAAFHEAGHAVVALELGSPYARLFLKRDHSRDLTTQSGYRGQCRTLEIKGKMNNAARSFAGVVAETLYDDLEAIEWTVWDNIDLNDVKPSASDMECIQNLSHYWQRRAIQLSLEILKRNWTAVRGIAFELHENYAGEVLFGASCLKDGKWRGLL